MHEILRTSRLRLRRFEVTDIDNLVALYSDKQVMRYIDDGTFERPRIESEVLPELMADYSRYLHYGYWAVETLDGSFLGRVALHPVVMAAESDGMAPRAHRCLGCRLDRLSADPVRLRERLRGRTSAPRQRVRRCDLRT
ncbi:MAG: GNAT family N-acetyltransferase [Microlunatus sp.]